MPNEDGLSGVDDMYSSSKKEEHAKMTMIIVFNYCELWI